MQAWSLDLRVRIIKSWQQGQQKSGIARAFMVSLSTVKRYIKRYQTLGHVRPTVQRRQQGKFTKRLRKRMARQVENHADFTLAQHAELWERHEHMSVSESTLSRVIRGLGLTLKKKTLGAAERDEAERAVFQTVIRNLPVEDVVVVDEFGSRIGMIPLYARAIRGQRAYDQMIRNYGQNLTVLASMSIEGMQAAMSLEGAVDEAAFETFICQVLLPTLHPGQIVILDNLSSHKTDYVKDLLTQAGCQVLFLPTYSPDFSPIEEAFSKLKAFLRRSRCRTIPALIRAIEQGLKAITSTDAIGWFAHSGFSVAALVA
jgi:transposase